MSLVSHSTDKRHFNTVFINTLCISDYSKRTVIQHDNYAYLFMENVTRIFSVFIARINETTLPFIETTEDSKDILASVFLCHASLQVFLSRPAGQANFGSLVLFWWWRDRPVI